MRRGRGASRVRCTGDKWVSVDHPLSLIRCAFAFTACCEMPHAANTHLSAFITGQELDRGGSGVMCKAKEVENFKWQGFQPSLNCVLHEKSQMHLAAFSDHRLVY